MAGNIESKNIAKRYALSLFEVSRDQNKESIIFKDIKNLKDTIKTDSALSGFFYSKSLRSSDQVNVIDKSFKKAGLNEITSNFLKVLAENSRLDLIDEVSNELIRLYNSHELGQKVVVEIAHEPSESQKSEVEKTVKDIFNTKKINLKFEVKSSLIAGFRVLIGSKVYDFTTARKLQNIKKHLISNL